MRTIRIFALLFFAVICIRVSGQTVQNHLTVTLTNYDYSVVSPVIGVVNGTLEYHFTYRLSKEGFIESMHWNATDCDLVNTTGDKVTILDTGNDNLGVYWQFFNTPNASNDAIQPGIRYNVEDGWLDTYMPVELPVEGVYVENLFTFKCNGVMIKWPLHIVFHMNANGVYTVEMIKP